jgi:hypothetical protein
MLPMSHVDHRRSPDGIAAAVGSRISGGLIRQEAARVAGLISAASLPASLVSRDINTQP